MAEVKNLHSKADPLYPSTPDPTYLSGNHLTFSLQPSVSALTASLTSPNPKNPKPKIQNPTS